MWWGDVQCAAEVQSRGLVRIAAGAWRSNCARCRLLHLCNARTQRRPRDSLPSEQSGVRQRSRHAGLTLCSQAAPLSCSLPELRVPRGETAGAAFLLEGVTVQARLPKLPGRRASGRLPLHLVSVRRRFVRPSLSTLLPYQAGDRDLLVDVDWTAMPGHRVGLVGANGMRAAPGQPLWCTAQLMGCC